ncbi:MAG: hypothetical protein EBV92_10425, partial [Betaproteobacteria bacterium]|nr:hypothetical protein [Betaproteobacteria bacterium]
DGLLVRDLDGDGVVDNGAELFGTATRLSNGETAQDGFAALADLDSNGDGRIDGADAAFGRLKVWVDANSDGVTDAGELQTLGQVGVVSIALQAQAITRRDQGNVVGLVATFERTDGTKAEIADVWFQVSSSEALDEQAAQLGEALKSYAGAGAAGATQSGSGTATAGAERANAGGGSSLPAQDGSGVSLAVADLSSALRRYELERATRSGAGSLASVPSVSPLIHRDRGLEGAVRESAATSSSAQPIRVYTLPPS